MLSLCEMLMCESVPIVMLIALPSCYHTVVFRVVILVHPISMRSNFIGHTILVCCSRWQLLFSPLLSSVRIYLLAVSPHYPYLNLRTRQHFKYSERGNSLEYGSKFLVFDFILRPSSEKPFCPPFSLGIFIEVFLMCPSGRKSLGRPPA